MKRLAQKAQNAPCKAAPKDGHGSLNDYRPVELSAFNQRLIGSDYLALQGNRDSKTYRLGSSSLSAPRLERHLITRWALPLGDIFPTEARRPAQVFGCQGERRHPRQATRGGQP